MCDVGHMSDTCRPRLYVLFGSRMSGGSDVGCNFHCFSWAMRAEYGNARASYSFWRW